jgi:hypothetical protein
MPLEDLVQHDAIDEATQAEAEQEAGGGEPRGRSGERGTGDAGSLTPLGRGKTRSRQ